ncbi:hypothetical protein HYZ70_03215 [Candidatus Curtissbacteria bacterium]|nr:hypothetical protein [Candidatus Curtissbacteria bacterium]
MAESSSERGGLGAKALKFVRGVREAAALVYKGFEIQEPFPAEEIDRRVVAQQILKIRDNKIAPSDITYHLGHEPSGKEYQKATAKIRGILQGMVSDRLLDREDHEATERGDTATYPIKDREAIEKIASSEVSTESFS